LTISEEVENIKNDRRTKKAISVQDKLLINVCYLMSIRFQPYYDTVLKLISAFVLRVGSVLSAQHMQDLLLVVSELKLIRSQPKANNNSE